MRFGTVERRDLLGIALPLIQLRYKRTDLRKSPFPSAFRDDAYKLLYNATDSCKERQDSGKHFKRDFAEPESVKAESTKESAAPDVVLGQGRPSLDLLMGQHLRARADAAHTCKRRGKTSCVHPSICPSIRAGCTVAPSHSNSCKGHLRAITKGSAAQDELHRMNAITEHVQVPASPCRPRYVRNDIL